MLPLRPPHRTPTADGAPGARRPRRWATAGLSLVAAVAPVTLPACSSVGSPRPDEAALTTTTTAAQFTIIDVRSPAEFATGHLDGAINIDLASADFDARIAALDPDAAYGVYCRTGVRAAEAAAALRSAGFTDVQDLGAMASAATTTGHDIVS